MPANIDPNEVVWDQPASAPAINPDEVVWDQPAPEETMSGGGAGPAIEPQREPSFFRDVVGGTLRDVAGVVQKVKAGAVRGATLGVVNPEEGTVGIPFTNIKAHYAPPLPQTLQEGGVSKEIAENPYIGMGAELIGTGVPWTGITRGVSAGINTLRGATNVARGVGEVGSRYGLTAAQKAAAIAERVGTQALAGGVVGAAEVRPNAPELYPADEGKVLKLEFGLNPKSPNYEKDKAEIERIKATAPKPGVFYGMAENALTGAAFGAGMQLAGEGVQVLAQATGLTRSAAYKNLHEDLSDLFFKNNKVNLSRPEAETIADQAINAAATKAGLTQDSKWWDFVKKFRGARQDVQTAAREAEAFKSATTAGPESPPTAGPSPALQGEVLPPEPAGVQPRPAEAQAAPNFELIGKPYSTDPKLDLNKVVWDNKPLSLPAPSLTPPPASGAAPGGALPSPGVAPEMAGGGLPPPTPGQALTPEQTVGPERLSKLEKDMEALAGSEGPADISKTAVQPMSSRVASPELANPLPEARPSSQPKQPWEMTRGEYFEQGKKLFILSRKGMIGQHPDERIYNTKYHRDSIKQALASGKPVPPSVLAEYPDLAPINQPETFEQQMARQKAEREQPAPSGYYPASKKKAPRKETSSLTQWVKGKGGIWDKSLTGETQQFGGKESKTVALLRKGTGRPFDELAALAVEDGWLPPGSTSPDLIQALNRDIGAVKQKRPELRPIKYTDAIGQAKRTDKEFQQYGNEIGAQADELVAKGWNPKATGEKTPAGKFDIPGTKVLIKGEEFTSKGFDKNGKVILEDGETIKADPFDMLDVEATRAAGAPGVAEPHQKFSSDKVKLFKSYGAEIKGDKVVLYRGGNVAKKTLSNLRYGDHLSTAKIGADVTGNEGAEGYGKTVVRFELPLSDVEVTGAGEFQFKGKSKSLKGGGKYPEKIYRAYNDYYGSNLTAPEIDRETNVRQAASMALPGGKEEFDLLLKEPQWKFGERIPFGAVEVLQPGDIKKPKVDKAAQANLFPEPPKAEPKKKGPTVEQLGLFREGQKKFRPDLTTTGTVPPMPVGPKKITSEIKSEPDYVYHATIEDRLQEIAETGMLRTHRAHEFTDQGAWPDGSTQKRSYFSRKADIVWQFAPEEGTPVVIRTKGAGLKRESTGDIYSEKPIPVKNLEYLGKDDQWHPVSNLKPSKGPMVKEPRYYAKKEKYAELRGEHGPFHDVWRIYDKKTGQKASGVDYSSPERAESVVKRMNEGGSPQVREPQKPYTSTEALKREAEKLGVTYKGEWKFGGKKLADNYTDKLTKGDFAVGPGGNLKDAVLKHRKSFVEAGNIDKSALNLKQDQAKYGGPGPVWFSQLSEVLGKKLPNTGTPETFLDTIRAWSNKGEFKPAELKWSGLEDWLKEQKGKVTKAEVLDYLKANQVEVKEVVKGKGLTDKQESRLEFLLNRTTSRMDAADRAELQALREMKTETKFSTWVVPGGKNYREMLLILPDPAVQAGIDFDADGSALAARDIRRASKVGGIFEGGHFSEPNVMAHVRFDEREGGAIKKPSGPTRERVLFLEELQSDWALEGRKKGYGLKETGVWMALNPVTGERRQLDTYGEMRDFQREGWNITDSPKAQTGVPPFPFAKTWPELTLKRMLRYAAENGYDRLSWINGEETAKRYDLSKQVDTVTYERQHDGRDYRIVLQKDGKDIIDQVIPTEKLPENVGKEVAEKIINGEGQRMGDTPYTTLHGLDLKTGGTWAFNLYDKIVPEFLKKYGKKWGAGVEGTAIDLGKNLTEEWEVLDRNGRHVSQTTNVGLARDEAFQIGGTYENIGRRKNLQDFQSIPITSSMRSEVTTRGQVLFQKQKEFGGVREALLKQWGHQYDLFGPRGQLELEIAIEAIKDLKKVEALPVKGSGMKTLGKAISTELIKKGYVNFTGRKFNDLSELVQMFHIYRNPKFETSRFIFVKKLPLPSVGYEILGHEGRTSNIPGLVKMMNEDPRNPQASDPKEWYALKKRMERLGADGYFTLHNHPSGYVKASPDDKIAAAKLRDNLPGFKGSLIIDHEKFYMLIPDVYGGIRGHEIPLDRMGKDKFLTPSKEHNLLGTPISSPKELAAVAQQIEMDDNHSVIFFMDSHNEIRGIHDVHNSVIRRADFPGYLRNQCVEFGSMMPLLVTKDMELNPILSKLYQDHVLPEAMVVRSDGVLSQTNTYTRGAPNPKEWMGKKIGSLKVAEPVVAYGQADPRHVELNDKLTTLRKDLTKIQRERDNLESKVNRLDRHIGGLKTEQAKRINTELRRRAKLQRVDRERKVMDLIDKIHETERAISRLGGVGSNTIVKRRQMGEKKEIRFAPPVTQKEFDVVKGIAAKPPMKGALREWFETAPRMWDHYGQKAKELFYRPATAARYESHKETISVFKQIDQQFKRLSGASSRRIGIHAIAQQPRGMKLLKEAGIEQVPTLTPEEMATYKWARDLLSQTYDRLQAARKVAGQKPFPPVQDYFTFMRNLNFWDRWGLNPATAELSRLPDYEVHLRSTPFRFAKHRTGGSYPVEVDAKFVLKNYMKSALTHIHMGPEIAKMRELVGRYEIDGEQFLLRDENPLAYQQITQWVDFISGTNPPTSLPEIIQKTIKGLSRNIVASTLAFSVRSALIQPTSLLQAWTRLGTRAMLQAVPSLFNPSEWTRAMETSHHLSPRIMDIALDRAVEELWGPVSRAKAKAVGAGFYFLRALDYASANYTWMAAEQAGKKAGLTGNELINFADDITVSTQGSGAREDISRIQRTILGHAMMLFQTFNINQWGFFLRDTLGMKGAEALPKREIFRRLLYFLVGATAINTVYEDILGMPSPLPTPINTYLRARDEGKTTSQALVQGMYSLAGFIPSMGGMRFGTTMLGAAADWVLDVAKKGAEWGGLKGQYVKPAPEIAMRGLGIPGTSQIYKTVRGLDKGLSPLEAVVGTTKSSIPGKSPVKRRTIRRPEPESDTLHQFMGIRGPRQTLRRGGIRNW